MRNSIDSSQADFLATHVPFKRITVNNVFNSTESTFIYSEEEFYNQHFCNADLYDAHQLIVVEGSSGSGKSHFIRWLNAKLTGNGLDSDVVILIRRDDNTLKGTIQQLLDVDVIKNIKNKEMYERLVRANKTISEVKFKNQIYHQYLVEIKSAIDSGSDAFPGLSNPTKRLLYALLNNDRFTDRLCSPKGPIERIFHKIAKQDGVSSDESAQFEESDFVLDTDFGDTLRSDGADNKAIKMVNKLIPDDDGTSLANAVAEYLNSLTDEVIQSCTGIEPGDFIQIFKEIRKELKTQGKNLILLVEDITSTIGINKALLEALAIAHTGATNGDELCRLVSVVGTTSEYYSSFRDNYKGRITTNIKIEDGSIGSNLNDLYEFFAKYLNAISVSKDDINNWYQNGALSESIPVYVDANHPKWEKLEINGRQFELYPFTKKAIANFYSSVVLQKTPRNILIDVLEPALAEVLYRKEKYLTFMNGKKVNLNDSIDLRIRNVVANLDVEQKVKEDLSIRSRSLVALYAENKTSSKSTYGVERQIWEEFGLGIVADKLGDTASDTINPNPVDPDSIDDRKQIQNPEYLSFSNNLNNWYYDKKIFNKSQQIRSTLSEIIFASIDWQKNNVPLKAKKLFEESSKDLFGFERQDRGLDKALIVLKANEETHQILSTVGKYIFLGNKSWNFEDSGTSIYYLTTWIENNKKKICEAILEETSKSAPYYIQCAIANDYYYRLLGGVDFSKQSTIVADEFLSNFERRPSQKYHGDLWRSLYSFLLNDDAAKKNFELLIDYYSLTQGVNIGSVKLINYTDFASAFSLLKRNRFVPQNKDNVDYYSSVKREIVKLYSDIEKRLEKVVEEEKNQIANHLQYLYSVFEFDESDDIDASDLRDLIKEGKDFYIDAEKYSFNINNKADAMNNLYLLSEEISKAIKLSKQIVGSTETYTALSLLSLNPLGYLSPLVSQLKELERDLAEATILVSAEEEQQKRTGLWSDNKDTRFAERHNGFYSLIEEVNDVTRKN